MISFLKEEELNLFKIFIQNNETHSNSSVYLFEFPRNISDWRYEELSKETRQKLQIIFDLLNEEIFKKIYEIKIYRWW